MRIFLLLSLVFLINGCATTNSQSIEQLPKTIDTSINTPATIAKKERNITFAPTFVSHEQDKYYDAIEIYDSSPLASQGVYIYDGLVFVVVVIDTNKEKVRYLEGTAMLRTVALLQDKYPFLPIKFHIRNRLIEKKLDDETNIYRYATVYRLKDILKKEK